MGESVKAVSAFVLIVAVIAAVIAWMSDSDTVTWSVRIGGVVFAMGSIALLLKLHFRTDLAPDYLRQLTGDYFNRDGFCFALVATAEGGICRLNAFFQSQHDQPCRGRIAIRPARGFLLRRARIETVTFDVECEPAAYGVASVAIPLPKNLQGTRQSFEVGATVYYPRGKGARLRFHDGILLRGNSTFRNTFGTALIAAGAATGQIVLVTPATASLILPSEVAEEISGDLRPETRIIWKLGDT